MSLSDRAVRLILSAVGDPDVRTEIQTALEAAGSIGAAELDAGAVANVAVAANAAIDFSKLAALPSAQVLVGSAGNVATAVAMSGDVTVSNAGVTAIGSGKVLTGMMNENLVKYADVTISSAEVLALFTSQKTLVAAPGANFAVIPLAIYSTIDYGAATYDAGTDTLDVKYNGGSAIMSLTNAFVESAADAMMYVEKAEAAFTPLANTAIVAKMSSANPITGDSAIKIRVYYRTVPILL